MKTAHKITLGTIGTTVAIIAGLFTIIEKTPSVITVIGSIAKAEASEPPDTVQVTRGFAGAVNKEVVQHKPMRGK